MPVFSLSCLLPTDMETAFRFHQDCRNLPRVQPWWAPVLDVQPSGPPAVGTRIAVICGGITRQCWVVEIEEIKPPASGRPSAWSIDRAIQSPFPRWRHCHRFERAGDQTRMTDRIEFQAPLGIPGLLLLPGIYAVLFLLFHHRHRQTRRIFAHE